MITQKSTNVPIKDFQESIRDWYAEMSQQFISANYRNFLEDQKKQQNFELQLERLELNFDEESKKTQLDVSQRLKQYLLQKESKDMAPRIQPQSVSSIPAVANVGKKHKQAIHHPAPAQTNSVLSHPAINSAESDWKRFEPTPELQPDNLFLPQIEETNYDPQSSITELEDDTLEVVCGNKSAAISENQLLAVPSPTSSASLFQVKPTTSEATKIEQPTTKEISASREAIGVAPPTTWGITGKTDLPKSADLELPGTPITKPLFPYSPSAVSEVKQQSSAVLPKTSFDIFQTSTPSTSRVDEVKPAFSFRTANSGNVESSTVGRTLQEEGQIVIPAFTGVAFDFKKDGKSDAESQKLPKSSESPVSFQFNKAAPPKPSLTQEPIAFQFNKAASPPSINKTTEKAEFAFQPNKDSSIAQASLFGTQPSGSSLFSSARAAVSPAAVVPSASVFPFASHAKSTSSSTAITPLSSLFSFAPKICSPDIANKLSITDLKGDEEIMDPNFLGGCKLAKWIQFYTTFHRQITAEISSFEKDADLKKLRISLKKSIVDKINFVAKKKATNQDLGKVFFYFFELFDFKTVKTEDNEDLKLDKENSGMINFVMSTICYRFIDKVKWDVDLTSPITVVIAALCVKYVNFYKVFCAEILHFSCMFPMSLSKILDKVLSFRDSSPEASTHWLASETAIFGLFFRVQFQVVSQGSYLSESSAQNVKGPELIKMLLVSVLELEKPVLLSSAFIVAEIFDNCVSQLSKTSKNFLSEVRKVHVLSARRIVNFKWEPVLEAICAKVNDEELKAVITTRHESLMCLLKNSFEKFESTPSTASA